MRTSPFVVISRGSEHAGQAWRAVQSQPSWIARLAGAIIVLVIAVPFVLLVLLALLAGVVVFGALALVNVVVAWVRGVLPRHDGRENVRVIRRD